MKAMVLTETVLIARNNQPLKLMELSTPRPDADQILIKTGACGVCHTELDEIEGRVMPAFLPIIPGHQVVGRVVAKGAQVTRFDIGDRVGVGWIYSACGQCEFCLAGNENLCKSFRATGRDAHGGYAEYMKIGADFAVRIPEQFSDIEAAPMLCAGGVGYRSLRLAGVKEGQSLGFTGFGASGHLVLKLVKAIYPGIKLFVFARSEKQQKFALELGADWAGAPEAESPEKLHAIIDTTPVWKPVVEALKNLVSGGRLVINAIRKETIDQEYLLKLDYARDLWQEKEIKSVTNVTRQDIEAFLGLASQASLKPEIEIFRLEEVNTALLNLKIGNSRGAKVISFN